MDVIGLALIILLLCAFVFWIVALVDAMRRRPEDWRAAGHSKAGWGAGLLLCGWVAGLVYWITVRPRLSAARGTAATGEDGRRPGRVPWRRRDWRDPWQQT